MKKAIISSVLLSSLVIGCGGKMGPPSPESVVAGDNAKLFETLKLADTAGTAKSAFTDAAADSSLRDKMEAALGLTARHTVSHSSASGKHEDVLDKSSDALDVANEKLTKTGTVLDKASNVETKTKTVLNKIP